MFNRRRSKVRQQRAICSRVAPPCPLLGGIETPSPHGQDQAFCGVSGLFRPDMEAATGGRLAAISTDDLQVALVPLLHALGLRMPNHP